MSACLFCEIAAGRQPASRVYEDDEVLAFMDLRQPNPGHVLVIPRAHRPDVFALEEELACHLFRVSARIARAVQAAYHPDGLNLWQSNGEAAGQEIFHFHIHVFARMAGDRLFYVYPVPPGPERRERLDEMAAALRATLGAGGRP
jgi:histidine triad (HIT) family protein